MYKLIVQKVEVPKAKSGHRRIKNYKILEETVEEFRSIYNLERRKTEIIDKNLYYPTATEKYICIVVCS